MRNLNKPVFIEWVMWFFAIQVFFVLGFILVYIFCNGLPVFSWRFFISAPSHGMTDGGILPAIIGTTWVTFFTVIFALPVGISCAIYFNEYAKDHLMTRIVRAAIKNLAGVPSIVFGLFGLAIFVVSISLGTSTLSAGLTLGLLTLPYTIVSTEEALRMVPKGQREAAYSLGATQWEVIKNIVLPQAIPEIATGVILTISRAAGETAPLLFTGATFYITGSIGYPMDEFMALPYHLYVLSTQHQYLEDVRPIAFATAATLLLFVLILNLVAIWIRHSYRK